ncbi:MAG: hypothetical protein ACK53Y_00800, partial [bacterium]
LVTSVVHSKRKISIVVDTNGATLERHPLRENPKNHNQNHIDAITTRIQTEEQMEHLGFEAELLK